MDQNAKYFLVLPGIALANLRAINTQSSSTWRRVSDFHNQILFADHKTRAGSVGAIECILIGNREKTEISVKASAIFLRKDG